MNLSFNNTEIAFRMKSDSELRRAYLLFRAIASPTLVSAGSLLVNVALKTGLPMAWIIKPTVFRQFCGGTTLEECNDLIRRLAECKVHAILDYSVEGKESEDDIRIAMEETMKAIRFAAGRNDIPFAVFKPTAFSRTCVLEKASTCDALTREEASEATAFYNRINTLCQAAYDAGLPILIDAEDSWYQKYIDEVVTEMMMQYNRKQAIVFNTFQMYRVDRLDFLKELYEKAGKEQFKLGAKFVRGAYMEKERARARRMGYPSPIHPDKESTDRDYNAALRFSVDHIDRISIFNGTHNEESSLFLARLMEERQIPRNNPGIWFSQLYGMSDHISFNLASEGYNVAKYIPYGPVRHVTPYLIRRARENTSVAGQTGRELTLISRERLRRKNLNHAN